MQTVESISISTSGLKHGDVVLIERDLRPDHSVDRQLATYIGERPVSVTVFQRGAYHEVPYCFFDPNDIDASLGTGVVHIRDYYASAVHSGEPKREDYPADGFASTNDNIWGEEDRAFNRYWAALMQYWSENNVQFYYVNTCPLFRLPDGAEIHGGECYWSKKEVR